MSEMNKYWQVTWNNPPDQTVILSILSRVKIEYYCFCYEIGAQGTYHCHIYLHYSTGRYFRTIKNLFPGAHIEAAHGSAEQNRAYILKDGDKYGKDDSGHYLYYDDAGNLHSGVNYSCTFTESGSVPIKGRQGSRSDLAAMYGMCLSGLSDLEILDQCPGAIRYLNAFEKIRQQSIALKYNNAWRDLEITYIFGASGAGKTRSVMDKYGYQNVYRVTDYRNPFDSYESQDVLLFDEFRSSLPLSAMLCYLDGYPQKLPARYNNKQACYTKVFVISNISLSDQFKSADDESRRAFFRRFTHITEFISSTFIMDFDSFDSWSDRSFEKLPI